MTRKEVNVYLKTGKTRVIDFTAEQEVGRDAEEAAWEVGTNDRAFALLRQRRNERLAATDWWVMRGSITEEQTSYRQALRDLPANTADPADITWPEEPE